MEWDSLEPVLTAREARMLLAFKGGCTTTEEAGEAANIPTGNGRKYTRRLVTYGYIGQRAVPKGYTLAATWDDIVDDLIRRIRHHHDLKALSAEEFRDLDIWKLPDRVGGSSRIKPRFGGGAAS